MELTIQKEQNDSRLALTLTGEINTLTAPGLRAALEQQIDNLTLLTLDFTKVEFISSAGLRVLLWAAQKMEDQGEMIVRNANAFVMDIFTKTGFDNTLTLE